MKKIQKEQLLSTPLFVIIGRAGGLIIPFIIARCYGASPKTDAFFFAYSLIVSILGVFTPLFESALLPYLAAFKKSPEKIFRLSNTLVLISLGVAVIISLAIPSGLTPLLMAWSGMSEISARLASRLFLELTPLLFLGILIAANNGLFYTNKIFWFPAMSPLLRSLWVIAFIIATHGTLGIHAVTVGHAMGEVIRWGAGLFFLSRLRLWKFETDWDDNKKTVKEFLGQAFFQMNALLALNLIPLTDQWFASWFGVGNVSLLSYADRLFQIPYQLFLSGILQIFLAYWSDNYQEEPPKVFLERTQRNIRKVVFIALSISVVFIILREPLTTLVFGFDKFSAEEIQNIQDLSTWLMLGLAPAVANLLYARVFFVLKKSGIFCVQSWLRFVLNILFNFVFIRFWGLKGIAMSTTCVFIVTTLWLHFYLGWFQKSEALKRS